MVDSEVARAVLAMQVGTVAYSPIAIDVPSQQWLVLT